jgi:hypothetical protein
LDMLEDSNPRSMLIRPSLLPNERTVPCPVLPKRKNSALRHLILFCQYG